MPGLPFFASGIRRFTRALAPPELLARQHYGGIVGNKSGVAIAGVDATSIVDAAFRRARIGMVIADSSGSFLEVNESLSEFLGYSADQLATMSFRDITFADDLAASA